MGDWWSAHTHTIYSALDAIAPPGKIVEKAARLGHPAVGFTDHGNGAGWVQGYLATKRAGMGFFPGVEAYLIDPDYQGDWKAPKRGEKVGRYHVGLLALDLEGWKALTKFITLTHTRPRFNRFARCTLEDLASLGQEAGDHIALTTGCFFGLVQQSLVGDGLEKAQRIVKMYAKWFPHTFVELQNHNIDHSEQEHAHKYKTDDDIVDALWSTAQRLGLPVITTQDSHYTDKTERKAHRMMKRMVYGGSEDEFPGDYFHLPHEKFVRNHYPKGIWSDSLEGLGVLLDLNKVTCPPLDNYQMHVPDVAKNPMKTLRRVIREAMDAHGFTGVQEYEDQLAYEDDVIEYLGMPNYFLMWRRIVGYCRSERIAIEARGSANGSLFNFLLGITQVDPVARQTSFDRFLSKDRKKPPDIDMDVEDVNRQKLIRFIQKTWPGSTQIGTWSKLGANDAGTGSVLVSYKSYRAQEAEREKLPGGKAAVYANLQELSDVERLYGKKDYEALMALSRVGEGVRGGKYGVYKSYGIHAAGILLSGANVKIDDYVPTMLVASSNTTVTQFDQDDVEEFGLLKNDILGQTSLTQMRICQEYIGRDDPTDFTWIPDDDPAACKLLREGRTDTGVFHYEGYTKAKGGKEIGVKSTNDAILGQALFMPGAMDSGQKDLYVLRRKNREARNNVTYTHDVFEKVLSPTYGAFIYQEQVIDIMRGLGMDLASINAFFKIVKDSGAGALERNAERIAPLREQFDKCCKRLGIDKRDAEKEWRALAGFVAYGFNKAHATGYGIRSYRCAYLKAHYPLEFMCALLQAWAGREKEKPYIREARRIGIRVLPPDVNVSTDTWTLDRKNNAIRKGLLSVPGVGPAAAQALHRGAPYRDLTDLTQRVDARAVTGVQHWLRDGTLKGTLGKLEDVGALDSLDHV